MLTSTCEVWLASREVRLALVLTGGFFVVVVVAALVVTLSGGDDTPTASNTTPSERTPVKVVIAGTNDANGAQTEGYIAGIGTFKATGAITDHGSVTAYRLVPNDELILLRFVSKGTKGTISFLVTIHHAQLPPTSRWKIESATKAYKGLHGEGTESEDAAYTVSTLRGAVWR
jgi:hypothetical protein